MGVGHGELPEEAGRLRVETPRRRWCLGTGSAQVRAAPAPIHPSIGLGQSTARWSGRVGQVTLL